MTVRAYSQSDLRRVDRNLKDDAPLWRGFKRHPEQAPYLASNNRFNVVPAGRRSGKTHCAKLKRSRRIVWEMVNQHLLPTPQSDPWYVFAAPTQQQAKRIWWDQLKRAFPVQIIAKIIESTPQTIRLINGAEVSILGLDTPARIEGRSLSGIVLDEYGNMKESVWGEHVRPALADYLGWADFIGVPEGRNHYYQLWLDALDLDGWGAYTWTSENILPESEIESLKAQLDPLTYEQEIGAKFVNFAGRAYHTFSDENKKPGTKADYYNENEDLILMLDFNVSPGIAAIAQEIEGATHIIDEIWVQRGSNTQRISNEIAKRYANHKGRVYLYGDASGGSSHSSQTKGSDWDIVKQVLRPVFGDRIRMRVPKANPSIRLRINSVNTRCCNQAGERRFFVVQSCRRVIEDFEGSVVKANGDLDKPTGTNMTHLTDAIGYYVVKRFPIAGRGGIIRTAA